MPAGRADAAVGIMDAAYFTGRRELLDFFNSLLCLNLSKIEQTCSGAVACQMTEYIFPGCIPMQRVNWGAKSDYEYVQNYKLLQAAFGKKNIQRHIDVDKLIRGKYQDNLEFCQWLKAFFDQFGVSRPDYDPVAVRSKGKGGKGTGGFLGNSSGNRSRPVPAGRTTTAAKPATTSTSRPLRERPSSTQAPSSSKAAPSPDPALIKKNTELTTKVEELEQNLVDIEKERDFYFQKLRDIEVMLQVSQEKGDESTENHNALIDKVFKVLYATAEDGLVVTDEGEVIGGADDTLVDDLEDAEADNLLENVLDDEY